MTAPPRKTSCTGTGWYDGQSVSQMLRKLFKKHFCSLSQQNMQFTSRVDVDRSDNTITYSPISGHSATIIFMHGLGDSADGISDIADSWSKQFPHIKFILPTATQRPVTLNGGMSMNAWYDIVGIDDRSAESVEGIEESVERIRKLLLNENSLGLPYSRMILAGFSQVGMS
jgi:lysophospholipase-2